MQLKGSLTTSTTFASATTWTQVFGNANLERDPTQESTQFIPPMDIEVIEVRANMSNLPSQRRE